MRSLMPHSMFLAFMLSAYICHIVGACLGTDLVRPTCRVLPHYFAKSL